MAYLLASAVAGFALSLLVARSAFNRNSLSFSGAIAATVVGTIHITAGWRYGVLLMFFFFSSSILTKLWPQIKSQKEEKFILGGKRNYIQVIANSWISTLISLYIIFVRAGILKRNDLVSFEVHVLFPTVFAFFCECCADTWASEIGILDPKPYLLLNIHHPVPPGTNGGMSVLGTAATGMAGITMCILYHGILNEGNEIAFTSILFLSLFSSVVGSFIDSLIGSLFELSWWCVSLNQIRTHLPLTHPDALAECCRDSLKEGRVVVGHCPSHCGRVCGKEMMNGSIVNALSDCIVSVSVFVYCLYCPLV